MANDRIGLSLRKTAIVVGILYVIGDLAGILSLVFATSVHSGGDFLLDVSAHENQVILGALLVLVMGLALAMVPVLMYPILKRQSQILAVGYLVFRGALETFTYVASAISWLLLVSLSRVYVQGGSASPSLLASAGLLRGDEINSITAVVFILGALMFYYAMYKSRLVPRWITGWGIIAVPIYLATAVLAIFNIIAPLSTVETVLFLPLATQEIALMAWLIVKGFNSTTISAASSNLTR